MRNLMTPGRAGLSAAGLSLALIFAINAATPAGGTLSSSTPTLSYTSGPFVISNPSSDTSGGVCPEDELSCDHYDLAVNFAGVAGTKTVTFSTDWEDASEDYDLYLLDEDDNVVGSSAGGDKPEDFTVTVSQLSNSNYRIRIIPFLTTGGSTTTNIALSGGGGGGDADSDGVSDATPDLCPNTPAGTAVDATGCPITGNRCVAPGLTVLTDAAGDQLGNPDTDILSESISESVTTQRNLVFTMKVGSLESLTPNGRWIFTFNVGAAAHYVAMITSPESNGGEPTFIYGPGSNGFGSGDIAGTGLAGSDYKPDGTITIVAPISGFALNGLDTLSGFAAKVQLTGGACGFACLNGLPADTATAPGVTYTLTADGVCGTASGGGEPSCTQSGISFVNGPVQSPGLWRDLARFPADQAYGAFVHFSKGNPAEHRARLRRAGLTIAADFERYANAVFASGPVSAFRALRNDPAISYLEQNRKLRFLGETQSWATRARAAQEEVSGGPYFAPGTSIPLRGQNVTVAVLDSGLNATLPDFAGRVLHNYKLTGDPILAQQVLIQDAGYSDTDTSSGHGTHVMGTAVGGGEGSTGLYPVNAAAPNVRGTFTSAAPGANLVAYSVGETPDPIGLAGVALLIYIDAAFQHLLDNFATLNPEVVSISIGDAGGTAYSAGDVSSCLIKEIVKKGANVVWAAGNSGGTGALDETSSFCKDPTPGVICVANYDDAGSGTINGFLSSSSSRGKKSNAAEFPDIAAPGTDITSTCFQGIQGQVTCTSGETRWQPGYGTITGTSMATPHVASTIALIAQAAPSLTPAQIENLIQDTARKIGSNGAYEADPQNAGGTTNFGFGAGLLDVQAALDSLGIAKAGLPALGAVTTIIAGDTDPNIAGAADVVGLTMQETPAGSAPKGIVYRLAVRAADFGNSPSGVIYRLEQNVNGNHLETEITATVGAVTASGGSALANSPTRAGNVVSFTVPYQRMGFPPLAAPIHNIRVVALDGASGQPLDAAPSPLNSTGVEGAVLRPMFGKAFTVQRPTQAPLPEFANACTGLTLFEDALGDDTPPLPTANNGAGDVLSLQVSEPANEPTKLVFKIKLRSLATLPPNVNWYVIFFGPAKGTNVTGKWHLDMSTDETSTPSFAYGRYNATSQNLSEGPDTGPGSGNQDETTAIAMTGSTYDPVTGIITLKVNKANFFATPAQTLPTLSNISAEVFQLVGSSFVGGSLQPIDTAGGSATYPFRAANLCSNVPPVANLTAVAAGAPRTVTFNISATDADNDPVTQYGLDFGDDSNTGVVTPAVAVSSQPATVTHTYESFGSYTAKLTVVDARGFPSTPRQLAVNVVSNTPPVVNAGENFSVNEGAGVLLSGTATDAEGGALSFAWTQTVGPALFLTNANTATASFTAPLVTENTVYSFQLAVTDSLGATGTDSVSVTVMDTADTTPNAFSFTSISGVIQNTVASSNVVTIGGIEAPATISVSLNNSSQYRINGGVYTSANGTISNGQTVQVRHTSAATVNTVTETSLNIGGVVGKFRSTTTSGADTDPDAFGFATRTGVAPSTPIESNTITPTGYDAPATVKAGAGTQYNVGCTGVEANWTAAQGTISSPQSICVRHTSAGSTNTLKKTSLQIGKTIGYFSTRTGTAIP